MSMNLIWYFPDRKIGSKYEEFFFQSPTSLTYDVIEEKDNENKIELIKAHLISRGWNEEVFEEHLKEMKHYLDNGVELVMI